MRRTTFAGLFLALTSMCADAAPLRRPVSPQTPMFLFMVQQPDPSDPQACVNALPADVKPYTVMEYCMGAQGGAQTNGYAFADYATSVFQQNGMWCLFQCASGDANTMANTNTADYERLFQKYSNLIGFGFSEQNYGFVTTSSPFGPSSFNDRLELFSKLLQVCNQYGGYLYSSEMQSYGGNKGFNMMAKLKSNSNFRNATVTYITNFIVGDKITQASAFYDNESCTLGTFLSGHAGYYASRFDETAWGPSGKSQLYGLKNPALATMDLGYLPAFTDPEATHGIFIVDHFMLQGATVIDGPEFPFISTIYQGRLTPCYKNVTSDVFRKVLDGTIRIPSVNEVRSNSPIVYVCDATLGLLNEMTGNVFTNLYSMDGDGADNHTWLKSTGRYPSFPETFSAAAYEMSFFKTNVLQTQIGTRWPATQDELNEFNSYFPSEYSTNDQRFFAARRDNRWFTYNPFVNSNVTTSANIPLQYNTCTNLFLQYPPQTFAVITESNSSLNIYFNNYFTDKDNMYATTNTNVGGYESSTFISNPTDSTTNTTRTTIFQISGCTNTPTYTLTDRGSHKPMTNSATFVNGVFTLTLTGNGPCDININCAGDAVRTKPLSAPNVMIPPANYVPPVPVPPGSVSVTPGYGKATFAWQATNCLYYNVKRGTSINGPFTTVASAVTNSINLFSSFISGKTVYNTTYNFTDNNVTVGNTYYYVVSGVNVSGEGTNSVPVVVTIVPSYTNNPIADSYVESSTAGNNYGTLTNMIVKNSSGTATRNAYLMFDVRSLTNARSATISLTANRVDAAATMYYELTPTNWNENTITWNNQPGGTGSFLFTNVISATGVTTFDVTGAAALQATNGGILSFRVTQQANNGNTLINFVSKESTIPGLRPLLSYTPSFGASPTGLIANLFSNNEVDLSWAGTVGANYYNVRRALSSGGPYTPIAQGVMATNCSDLGLDSGTTYYYAVSAVYGGGESADSNLASATTPTLPAPAFLNATLAGNQVTLNWPSISGGDTYRVKRSYTRGGPYTTIATGIINTNFTDSVYFTGANFYYVVVAADGGGEGTNSPEAYVTTPANLTVEPIDDTYVEDGTSTNSNFGTSANLKVKNQGTNTTFTRVTYLKFNVQALTNAQSVKLKLTPYQVDGAGVTNAFELVTNDAWSETNMFWTNQPGGSGVIITNMLGSAYTVGSQVAVDVTPWTLSQSTNDGYLSLRITDPNTNAILIGFWSKEAGTVSQHPVLQFVNPGNTAPVLAPISNQTIGVGTMLTIANSATDADVPAQTLTFGLLAAPTNAWIDSGNGLLTWRPLVTQANTTNSFTVVVTDSGSPTKTATQSFLVKVSPLAQPQLSMMALSGGQFELQVSGDSGPDYQIQTSTNLTDWNAAFTTNSPTMPFTWTNSIGEVPQNNFFRILVGPPLP